MSRAEEFIQNYTRNCSNEIIVPTQDGNSYTKGYTHWLTPDLARKAVEIAREETIKEVCEWIEENIGEYCDGENIMFSTIHIENIDVFGQEKFINDLKKHLEGKK